MKETANLYHIVEQFQIQNNIEPDNLSTSILIDYLLKTDNDNSTSDFPDQSLKNEEILERKIKSRLSHIETEKGKSISSLPKMDDIKKHEWYPFLSESKDRIVFFVQNKEELDYITPIIIHLNRAITLLCDFDLETDYFPSWITVILFGFSDQKLYENDFLENSFPELYNYYNAFSIFLEMTRASGIVVLDNACFQKKVISDLGKRMQIPVVALKYSKENTPLNLTGSLPYDHYIDLELSDKNSEKEKIISKINEYTPISYFRKFSKSYLHVGCGTCLMDNWLNVDLNAFNGSVYMNAEKKFPFPDSSFQYIFSEHLFEHLSYTGGKNMLNECYRVLKPGGILRLTMPGLEFLINLYIENNDLHEKYIDWSASVFSPEIKQDFSPDKIPPMFMVNNFMRFFGHQMIYDKKTLTYLLKKNGFKNVSYPEIGKSIHPILNDLEQHGKIIPEWANNLESFVVEAQK